MNRLLTEDTYTEDRLLGAAVHAFPDFEIFATDDGSFVAVPAGTKIIKSETVDALVCAMREAEGDASS
jgi:hypothetical protein